jgi:hypothetical protein
VVDATGIVTFIVCNIANELTSIEMKITSTWKIIVLKTQISIYIHKYIHTWSLLLLQSQIYVAIMEAFKKKGKTGWMMRSQVMGWDQVEGLTKSSCGIKTW